MTVNFTATSSPLMGSVTLMLEPRAGKPVFAEALRLRLHTLLLWFPMETPKTTAFITYWPSAVKLMRMPSSGMSEPFGVTHFRMTPPNLGGRPLAWPASSAAMWHLFQRRIRSMTGKFAAAPARASANGPRTAAPPEPAQET